jgi:hypothetical protein
MLICTRCGKENPETARSCLNCGARFGGQDEAAPFVTTRLDERGTTPLAENPWAQQELERARPHQQPLAAAGKKRDPLVVMILGFVTCYLYIFYWWYVTAADIKRATGRLDVSPQLELLLDILTCGAYSLYLSYKYPKIILEMQEQAQVQRNDTSLLSLLLSLFSLGPIACYFIQADLNKIWEKMESR